MCDFYLSIFSFYKKTGFFEIRQISFGSIFLYSCEHIISFHYFIRLHSPSMTTLLYRVSQRTKLVLSITDPKVQQLLFNQKVSISFHNVWLLFDHNSAHMLIYIEGHYFLCCFFPFPWTIFWGKVFNPFGAFGEALANLLQRETASWYFLCLNQGGSLNCSHVLALINSVSPNFTISPCIIKVSGHLGDQQNMEKVCLGLFKWKSKILYI